MPLRGSMPVSSFLDLVVDFFFGLKGQFGPSLRRIYTLIKAR